MCATKQSKVLSTEVPWFKISSTQQGFCAGQGCFVKITRFGGIQFSENRSAPGLKGKHLGISVSSPMRARISQRRCLQAGVEKVCSESLHEVFRAQRSHHTMSIYTMYIIYMIQYVYYVYYLYVYVYIYIYIFMCVRGFYCLSKVGWKIHSSGMTVWHVFQQIWWLVVRVCFPMKLPALTSFPNNGTIVVKIFNYCYAQRCRVNDVPPALQYKTGRQSTSTICNIISYASTFFASPQYVKKQHNKSETILFVVYI